MNGNESQNIFLLRTASELFRCCLLYTGMNNPRNHNGNLRRKHKQRMRAMGLPCAICGGRLGPIRYDQPSAPEYPLSFVIDEIKPVSRWKEFGYSSAAVAANDWNNLQPAHRCCNAAKSNKTMQEIAKKTKKMCVRDGNW